MGARLLALGRVLLLAIAGIASLLAPAAAYVLEQGPILNVQGELLLTGGVPATGTYDMTFRLFEASSGGFAVWEQPTGDVVVSGGLFDVELGPFGVSFFAEHPALWLETVVGGDPLPRRPLRSVAYAAAARRAAAAYSLACTDCVPEAALDFPYAGASSKGGAATDLDCGDCVSGDELIEGAIATVHIQDGVVTKEKVAFDYAGSTEKGGAAIDVACDHCVNGDDVAVGVVLPGDVTVEGALEVCKAAGVGCGVKVKSSGLFDKGAGWLGVQVGAGLRVRDAGDTAWRPIESGGGTAYGDLAVEGGNLKVGGRLGVGTPAGAAAIEARQAGTAAIFQNTADTANNQVLALAAGARAVPTAGDSAYMSFLADDAGQDGQERARLTWVQTSPTEGSEDSGLRVHLTRSGSLTEILRLEFGADHHGTVAINPTGTDVDTRIGSTGNANALVVAGATGNVGVGVSVPLAKLDVGGDVRLNGHEIRGMRAENSAGAPVACSPSTAGYFYFDTSKKAFLGCDGSDYQKLSSTVVAPQMVPGFSGFPGPDLTSEGFSQCYGWKNDGSAAGASWSELRSLCGPSTTLVFAGYRSGSTTLIRHDVKLGKPFLSYLPASFPGGLTANHSFDAESKYSWQLSAPWILLAASGNGWTDPGRYWEVNVQGGLTADDGHVLSQAGNNAHDQSSYLGDTYFIYIKLNETHEVVPGFDGFYGPDLGNEGLVQCYGWWNDGFAASTPYSTIKARCGAGTKVVFAGMRAGSTAFIRHDAVLSVPFSTFLPDTFPSSGAGNSFFKSFDVQGKYSWWLGTPWLLLVNYNNGWGDPGRLWEPNVLGGTAAGDGHVLSSDGSNANDQANTLGDKYYIYINK